MSRGFQPAPRGQSAKARDSRLLAELAQVVSAHIAGIHPDPASAYRKLLAHGLRHPALFSNLASLAIQAGALEEARTLLQQGLELDATVAECWSNLGMVERQLGDPQRAIEALQRAVALKPTFLQAWINLSAAYQTAGRLKDALAACDRALALDANSAAAHSNRSIVLERLGRHREARQSALEALALDPFLADAHANLGVALQRLQQFADAEAALREAIGLRPDFHQAHANLGNVLAAQDRLDEAVVALERALELSPGYYEGHSNLGLVRRRRGELEASIQAFERALALCPESLEVRCNLAIALTDRGELEAARHHFEEVLRTDPDQAKAHMGLSAIAFHQGRFQEGWNGYAYRFANSLESILQEPEGMTRWSGPSVDGEPLPELVLVHEQGLGDTLQFVRFAPRLRPYARRISLACPEKLHGLLGPAGLVDALYPLVFASDSLPCGAVWVPLLSVPGILGIDAPTACASPPTYLVAEPDRLLQWQRRLDQPAKPGPTDLLIGLSWQGSPLFEKSGPAGRSVPLEALAPLASALPGVRFVSLQKGFGAEQLPRCSFRDRFVSAQRAVEEAWAFEDAAAIMACCSVVISSDTATAHLAGALGLDVRILLQRVPEWRWGLEGTSTPWYPTATLYRQSVEADWSGPVAALVADLQRLIQAA